MPIRRVLRPLLREVEGGGREVRTAKREHPEDQSLGPLVPPRLMRGQPTQEPEHGNK